MICNTRMDFLKKIKPELALRFGLGLMYIYSGFDLFYYPSHWYGFAPQWFLDLVTNFISIDTYFRIQGVGELIMGLLFLAWFGGVWGVRIASFFATLEMALIILLTGINLVTFRDIGLLGAAIAILIMSWRKEI